MYLNSCLERKDLVDKGDIQELLKLCSHTFKSSGVLSFLIAREKEYDLKIMSLEVVHR